MWGRSFLFPLPVSDPFSSDIAIDSRVRTRRDRKVNRTALQCLPIDDTQTWDAKDSDGQHRTHLHRAETPRCRSEIDLAIIPLPWGQYSPFKFEGQALAARPGSAGLQG